MPLSAGQLQRTGQPTTATPSPVGYWTNVSTNATQSTPPTGATQDPTTGEWLPPSGWTWELGNAPAAVPLPGYNVPPQPYGVSPPSFNQPAPFQAPSISDALNQPGYQFQLGQGETALQNWAAAQGTLDDSSTAQNLTSFAENSAQSDYQNVYNQQLGQYQENYQTQYLDPFTSANTSWLDSYNAWVAQQQNLLSYRQQNITAG